MGEVGPRQPSEQTKTMATRNRRDVLALGLGIWLGGRRLAWAEEPSPPLVEYSHSRDYEVRHRMTLDLDGLPADAVELWLPVPVDDSEQTVRDVQTEPRAALASDSSGLARVARLLVPGRGAGVGKPIEFEVRYRVACRETIVDREALARYDVRTYKKDQWYRFFTRATTKIQTTDRRVRKIAEECRAAGRRPQEIARAAYDWVLEHTTYRRGAEFVGAVGCLERGHGQCGDYTALWVAICRAAGLPARMASGCWADEEDGWHCWGQFMLPDGQWLPVDPAQGDGNPWSREYHFGATDNRRVALCKIQDLKLRMAGSHVADTLQTGAWWWQGRVRPTREHSPKAVFNIVGQASDSPQGGSASES